MWITGLRILMSVATADWRDGLRITQACLVYSMTRVGNCFLDIPFTQAILSRFDYARFSCLPS